MTSIISWSGADSHGTSSMYFASDSRISWDKTGKVAIDAVPKVMASTTQPEIFGFTGYVLLPYIALSQACTAIDCGLRGQEAEESADSKREWLSSRITKLARSHPKGTQYAFTVLYGIRTGSDVYISRKGKEPPVHSHDKPKARFDLYLLNWDGQSDNIEHKRYPASQTKSSILKLSGTGEESIKSAGKMWEESSSNGTSRTMFSSLCQSLKSCEDPQSGGAPQLVGMYRKGTARIFGVVTTAGPFFQGVRLEDPPGAAVEWRDELLRRVDSTGALIVGAKARDSDLEFMKFNEEKSRKG